MRKLPKCGSCGARDYRVDGWMNGRDTKAMACCCQGYVPFTRDPKTTVWTMHRKGSPYCWFRKDGTQRMEGDADYRDALQEQEPPAIKFNNNIEELENEFV
jgi:hypothetical protein